MMMAPLPTLSVAHLAVLSAFLLSSTAQSIPHPTPAKRPEPVTIAELFDPSLVTAEFKNPRLTFIEQTSSSDENDSQSVSGKPNDMPFGLVALLGESTRISDLTSAGGWALLGCNPNSISAQAVFAVCINQQLCSDVFNGGAADTIVKMPDNCGAGPYARVVALNSLTLSQVPSSIRAGLRTTLTSIFSLKFDYAISSVKQTSPHENLILRVDASNIPGYFDSLVQAASPNSKRSPPSSEYEPDYDLIAGTLEKRFTTTNLSEWFHKVLDLSRATNADIPFSSAFNSTLMRNSTNCVTQHGSFEATVDMKVSGSASMKAKYGFYLEAHILPLNATVDHSFLFLSSSSKASMDMSVTGRYFFDNVFSVAIPVAPEVTFPGVFVPGLVSINPRFNIFGQSSGFGTSSGSYTAHVNIDTQDVFTVVSAGQRDGCTITDLECEVGGSPVINFEATSGFQPVGDVTVGGDFDIFIGPEFALDILVLDGLVNVSFALEFQAHGRVNAGLPQNLPPNSTSTNVQTSVEMRIPFNVREAVNVFSLISTQLFSQTDSFFNNTVNFTPSGFQGIITLPHDVAVNSKAGPVNPIGGLFACPA